VYNPFNSQAPLIPTGSSKQRLLEAEYLRNADLADQAKSKQAGSPLEAIVNAITGHMANKNAMSAIERSGAEADAEAERVKAQRTQLMQAVFGVGQAPQSSPIVDAIAPAPMAAPTGVKPDYRAMQAAIPDATGPLVGQGVPSKAPVPPPPMPSQFGANQASPDKMAAAMQLMELNDPVSQAIGQKIVSEMFSSTPADIRTVGNQIVSVNPKTGEAKSIFTGQQDTAALPSVLQITNAYEQALAEGKQTKANNILMFAKALEKGTMMTPEGAVAPMPGAIASRGEIKKAEAAAQQVGSELGTAQATLTDLEANMPKLEALTQELEGLADKATYTYAGRALNEIKRQTGQDVGEGAEARAKYQSLIDNNILPLLRMTFGAQFTQKEGESLKATLGDVNLSPQERKAVLESFITQKRNQVEALQRQTGAVPSQPSAPTVPDMSAIDAELKRRGL